jgi:uncharacterized protein (TIGR00255 family)
MTNSMTGFAARAGASDGWQWSWDVRAVNARGMDLRLRLPDWIDGLEVAVRAAFKAAVARGNLNLSLKLQRDATTPGLALNHDALDGVLMALRQIEDSARTDHDLDLAPTSAADILAMRAITENATTQQDTAPLLAALKTDLAELIAAFNAMRSAEGAALATVIGAQIDRIESLTHAAAAAAHERRDAMAATLRENLARVLDNAQGADPDRVAQELAMIAVKTDVTEEIDRLHTHVGAARALLVSDGPVGRKLDFLSQEFNREANTLCSKAQSSALSAIGLDLKAVIDQMREQVQNVE